MKTVDDVLKEFIDKEVTKVEHLKMRNLFLPVPKKKAKQ